MRSTVSMMFAPGCRRTMISTERTPLVQPATRVFSTLSSTLATSPSRTVPPGVWATSSSRYWSARKSWSLVARVFDWSSPPWLPMGLFTEAPASTWRTSARVRFTPAAASGSTCTRTAGCCPPPTKTCPTPSTCAIFWASTVFAASKT